MHRIFPASYFIPYVLILRKVFPHTTYAMHLTFALPSLKISHSQ